MRRRIFGSILTAPAGESATTNFSAPLLRDLVSHWSFEETGGYRADNYGIGQLSEYNSVGSTPGLIGNAANVVAANDELLEATLTDTNTSPGDADFTVAAAVELSSKTADSRIVTCDTDSTKRSWRLEYDVGTDRFRFLVFAANSSVAGIVRADSLGSPSVGTTYFIVAWHDVSSNEISIQVNDGSVDTVATTAAVGQASTRFFVGGYQVPEGPRANLGDLWVDEAAFWRRLLSAAERTSLYASGNGLPWADYHGYDSLQPLHIAWSDDVIAYDATQFTYQFQVDITQTGRHAIGVMTHNNNDGDTFRLSVDGVEQESRVFDNDQLANQFGTYFEDGFVVDFTTTGTKTILIESVGNASLIRGVIAREPDSVSGIVEDTGTATHCNPLRCDYGGASYRTHVELYTGNHFLVRNGVLQGQIFSGIAADYNERYHNGAFICAISSGVVVGQIGHNDTGFYVKYLPNGSYANATSAYHAEASTTQMTYSQVQPLSDDRVAIFTRVIDKLPALVILSDLDQIDGTGASSTLDIIYDNGTDWTYPKGMERSNNGGTEVLTCLFNERTGGTDWGQISAALFCPQEGTHGKWYTLDGVEATNNTALGTQGNPRFNATMRGALTGSGGIKILDGVTNAQRYALTALTKISQWPSGATPAKGKMFGIWCDSPNPAGLVFDTCDIRFLVQDESTKILDSAFNALPTDDMLGMHPWNYRINAAAVFEDDVQTNDMLLAVEDRRFGQTGSGYGPEFEAANTYYDWGANELVVLRVSNPHDPNAITFAEAKRVVISAPLRGGFVSIGGENRLVYQTGENQLHATHRQAIRREVYLGS